MPPTSWSACSKAGSAATPAPLRTLAPHQSSRRLARCHKAERTGTRGLTAGRFSEVGAGKENRTPLASMGSWCITTMLYPLRRRASGQRGHCHGGRAGSTSGFGRGGSNGAFGARRRTRRGRVEGLKLGGVQIVWFRVDHPGHAPFQMHAAQNALRFIRLLTTTSKFKDDAGRGRPSNLDQLMRAVSR